MESKVIKITHIFFEDILRRLPIWRRHKPYRKEVHLPGRPTHGYANKVRTRRDVWEDYKVTMRNTENYLVLSVIAGAITLVTIYTAYVNQSTSWALASLFSIGVCAFAYSHSRQKYDSILDFENMPVLTPPDDIFIQAERCGIDLEEED